ncbi:hypothetical protein LBYZC6_20070 [Lacrimispora brassicae]
MDTTIKGNGITFKELEKNIYQWIRELEKNYTRELLKKYDAYLMGIRDRAAYRHKGQKKHYQNCLWRSHLLQDHL